MSPRLRTTPRKRPKQDRSRETVEAILLAAARILVRFGYDRASTNRIAEAAGVSVGSLYQYFPSKEALVAALVDRHVSEMSEVLAPALERLVAAPLPVAVREMVRLMLEAHAIDPELHRILVEQTPRIGRLERVVEVERRFATLARAYLEAHRGEVRRRDLDLAASIVVHAVESLTHAAVLHRPELLAGDRLVGEIVQLVVAYLTSPELEVTDEAKAK
jgi:AcrR family transcriptional regulator